MENGKFGNFCEKMYWEKLRLIENTLGKFQCNDKGCSIRMFEW